MVIGRMAPRPSSGRLIARPERRAMAGHLLPAGEGAARRPAGPATLAVDPFGFSWPPLFRRQNLDSRVLGCLGIPWIPSSESRLINGLHEIFVSKFFLSLFPVSRIAETGARGRGMRKRRIPHQANPRPGSAFPQENVDSYSDRCWCPQVPVMAVPGLDPDRVR
jgi:hypothetical protein